VSSYEHAAEECREVVMDGIGQRFVRMFRAKVRDLEDDLRTKSEPRDLFRAQGAVNVLEEMLDDLKQERRPQALRSGGVA
jgi:hypothetical protein